MTRAPQTTPGKNCPSKANNDPCQRGYRTAEKSFSRYLTAFYFNFKYIFSARKPVMMGRVARNYVSANLLRKAYPRTLDLNITFRCNLSCQHCFAEAFLTKVGRSKPLAPTEYRNIAGQAIGMGFTSFTITGGEPFCNKDIFEIIRSIHPEKVWLACATNGTLCDREALVEARRGAVLTAST